MIKVTMYFFEIAYHYQVDEMRLSSVLEVMQREISRLRQEYEVRYFDIYHQYVCAPLENGTVSVMLECIAGGHSNENLRAMLEALGNLFERISDRWDFYTNEVNDKECCFTDSAKSYWRKKYGCEL